MKFITVCLLFGLILASCGSVKLTESKLNKIKKSKSIVLVIGDKLHETGQANFGGGYTGFGLLGAAAREASLSSSVNGKIQLLANDFKAIDLAREIALPLIKGSLQAKVDIHTQYIDMSTLPKMEKKDGVYNFDISKVVDSSKYDYAIVIAMKNYGVFRPVKLIAYRPHGNAKGGIKIINLKDNKIVASSNNGHSADYKVPIGWKNIENYNTLRERVKMAYKGVIEKSLAKLLDM